jgi:hypothetical protein
MIIRSQWRDFYPSVQVSLILTAYSFNDSELEAVPEVLSRARIEPRQLESVPKDPEGRAARRFGLNFEEIEKLETRLDIKFLADPRGNVAIVPRWYFRGEQGPRGAGRMPFNLWLPPGAGRSYCCRELTLQGDGTDSIQITADDDVDATFTCALLGGQRNWFGAKPSKGPCPRKP